MAIFTGTLTKYGHAGSGWTGLREDLSNVISRVSPEETLFLSSMGGGPKPKNTLVEWQTDSLASPSTANAQLEGDDITSVETSDPTVRVGNYCQISRKTLAVSGTNQELDYAGRKNEMARLLAKKSVELKRDIESIMLTSQAPVAGGNTTARKIASLTCWLKTNTSRGTAGADPSWTSGVPTNSTDETTAGLRTYTETIMKTVLQSMWTNGAKHKIMMVGPVNKQRVSTFDGIVTQNINQTTAKPTAIIGAADVYAGDFGTIRVVPNRLQRERDAWFLDFDFLKFRMLRPFKTEKLAKTGDADKRMLLVEWTMEVRNEAALGLAADLTTS